jgi:ATP-dependent RNA helicase DHX8/PRP22
MDTEWSNGRGSEMALAKLQLFALLSKICKETENHLGMADKTLAEFIVDLALQAKDLPEFSQLLTEKGAAFPSYFTESLYRMVHSLHPSKIPPLPPPPRKEPQPISRKRELSPPPKETARSTTVVAAERRQEKRSRFQTESLTGSNRIEIGSGPSRAEKEVDALRTRGASPDRWELAQLRNAGLVSAGEAAEIAQADVEENLEDVEIELNDKKPPFLLNRATLALPGMENTSPIRVVRNPEGSLQRAAMSSSGLAAERRALKESQKAALGPADPDNESVVPTSQYAGGRQQRGRNAAHNGREEKEKEEEEETSGVRGRKNQSMSDIRASLPIASLRGELMQAIADNQVLVVIGETGSGKTTQITQYLAECGYARKGRIGCTQPRRVAATSVAQRVAEECGVKLGEEVGYAIRFDDCTSARTRIKYMTDGVLLRECLMDPRLSAYSVLILDEAHERTIHTDVLFGLLKEAVRQRPNDLKLIVTSATLDAERFSEYFLSAPIFTILGRTFPVEILYTKEPQADYLDASLQTVLEIHLASPPGDILLFLTGQEEIETAAQVLGERMQALGGKRLPELIILPVYSALPSEMQTKIFEPAPPGKRKVVIATNIAETSLTIDGIFYVIDPGFCKQKIYNPRLGMDSLVVTPISQAQARQRAGRAGRIGPGKCYRLYTEDAFKNEMLGSSVPEIQRTNLGNTVLMLKAMGIHDLLNFDFMDAPPRQTLNVALQNLYYMDALDDEGLLTRFGRKMAEFPLDPPLAKMLLMSVDLQCSDEVLTVVAMLSVENVFYRPKEKAELADKKKGKFFQAEGDHLTLLSVYEAWQHSGCSPKWCFDNFVHMRSLRKAQDVRRQLLTIMDRYRLPVVSCGSKRDLIRKAIVAGFFNHAARKDEQEGFRTVIEQQQVYIHPSSSLGRQPPDWVVYHELVLTTREYMRNVMAIDPRWLPEVAPNFYREADANKLTRRRKGVRIEPLHNRFAEHPDDWRISRAKKMR